MTDPSIVGASFGNTCVATSGTAVTVTLPNGITTGDVGVVVVNCNNLTATLTASGWTVSSPFDNGTTMRSWILTRTTLSALQSGTTMTATLSATARWAIGGVILHDATRIDTPVTAQDTSLTTAINLPAFTPGVTNEFAIAFAASARPFANADGSTAPTGWTPQQDLITSFSGATDIGLWMGTQQLSTTATVTPPAGTWASQNRQNVYVVTIAPAVQSGAVAATATSTLTVGGTRDQPAAVAMSETSTLTVAGTITGAGAVVAMTETSTMTVAGARQMDGAVAMTATSTLTAGAGLGYTLHSYEEGTNGASVPNSANGVIALIGTPTYATASAVHGSMGVHTGTTNAMLGYANPAVAGSSGQLYGKLNALSTTLNNAIAKFTDSSNTVLSSISIKPTGAFVIIIGGTIYATSTVTVAAGDSFRLDWNAAWDGTNMAITARLFLRSNSEGRTRDQEITATHTQASSPVRVFIGVSTTSTWDIGLDTYREYVGLTWPPPFNPSITPGTVSHSWSGDPLADGFVVTVLTVGCTSLRMAVSTSSGMTSPTYFGPVVPDSAGYATFITTGLSAATTFWCQLADTPVGAGESLIGSPAKTKTTPAVGSPQNFTVALMSCQLNSSIVSAALDDIVTWDPTFGVHTGDIHYKGILTSIPADHAAGLANQIQTAAGLKNMLASVPLVYVNSDHESGLDNSDSNIASFAAFNTAYVQVVPSRLVDTTVVGGVPSPKGKYRTWVVGRIRFILLDTETTDRSPGAAVDNSSKTMLGSDQKTWFKAQLLQPEPLKVVISNNSWMGTSTGFQWQDKWQSYGTERSELAAFITANHVQVDWWHGDSHYVGVDNSHNVWGGFPVLCGSPLDQVGSSTDIAFFDSAYSSAAGNYSQYMRVTFTDDGVTITRTASGWDALNNVQRVTQTHTWSSMAVATVAMTSASTVTVGGTRAQFATVAMTATETLTADTSNPSVVGTIRLRRNTLAGAASDNPVLLSGEPSWNGDALRVGVAAGTAYNSLSQTMMEGAGTVTTVTTNYAAVITDRVIIGNGTTITVTLLAPNTANLAGRRVTVKNVHSGNLTVAGSGNIDGSASALTLAQWAKVTVYSDGTQWLTI